MVYFIAFVFGLIFGAVLSTVIHNVRSHSGVLKIDRSNPNKDVYRFDVEDLDGLVKKKFITLKVDNNADLSQK